MGQLILSPSLICSNLENGYFKGAWLPKRKERDPERERERERVKRKEEENLNGIHIPESNKQSTVRKQKKKTSKALALQPIGMEVAFDLGGNTPQIFFKIF